jgi:hypothetical protein
MTIIAYRRGVLASDGMTTRGDVIDQTDAKKVIKLPDGSIAGAAGNWAEICRWFDWLQAGNKVGAPDTPKLTDGSVVVIVAPGGKKATVVEDVGHYVTEYATQDWFNAWGSGKEAALGAMHHGATAAQAVLAAMKVYTNIGGDLFVEYLGDEPRVTPFVPKPKPEEGPPDAPVAA